MKKIEIENMVKGLASIRKMRKNEKNLEEIEKYNKLIAEFNLILDNYTSSDEYINEEYMNRVEMGIIETDGTPIKCEKCNSIDYREVITDKIDYIVMEKEAICNKCEHFMGLWVTGNWCS